MLLHLVDANDEDVATSYRIVRDELDAYGAGLADKPVVLALNKIDTLDDELIAALSAELAEASGQEGLSAQRRRRDRDRAGARCAARAAQRRTRSRTTGPAEPIEWSPL